MSSFGINLDLKLNGQSALDRAIRGTKALESIVKRLNDKPLDLSNIGGAAKLDEGRLGKARKGIIEFAQALAKQKEPLAKTEAGIREYVSAFSQLTANTKAGTPAFNAFVGVLAKAEKELEDIAHATENARRKALGLLSVEEEAAQLAQKAAQKKAKEGEADARKKNEKAIERENRKLEKLNRERKKEAAFAKRNRGRAIGDFAASVGFPLLSGGGIGSVAGGAIGSIVGSATGIGFGVQILGSALGQALDQAAQAANKFATTLTSATSSVDQLIHAVGVRGTGVATSAQFAQTLGIEGVARAGLQSELADIVGDKGVKSLEALADSSAEAANSVSQFGAKITASFAPALTAINKTISAVLGGNPAVQRLEQKEKDLAGLKEAGSQGFAIKRLEAEIAQLRRDSSEELARQDELKRAIKQVTDGMVGLEEQALALEQSKLTARRDSFAFAQGNLAVSKLEQELLIVRLELSGEITEERRKELELQEKILGVQIETAEAARNTATELARRQIRKEQMSGAVKQIRMIGQEKDMQLKLKQIQEGRFKLFLEELISLEDKLSVTEMTLDLEQKRDLIGVNEAERVASINRDYELRRRLAKEQYKLDLEALEQANAAYRLSRLQVEQEIKLQNLQARVSAAQQIRATSPFEQERFLSNPFFGESAQLQAEQTLRYSENLTLLGQQLDDVIAKQQIFALAPEVRDSLKDQENIIRNQIANFKEYQPAIDAAALAQARFNEAMAITVPVTDSLLDSLLSVVEGTKTAEQAFADFLRSIASILLDAAKQIIATYIAIGIARMFAGVSRSDGKAINTDSLNQIQGYSGIGASTDVSGFIPRANGGPVGAGQPYLVGERGPELFVPGAQGNIVPNNALGGSNIVVNVDASGSQAQGDSQRGKQLGAAIGAAVQAELIKQKRPGGLLAS